MCLLLNETPVSTLTLMDILREKLLVYMGTDFLSHCIYVFLIRIFRRILEFGEKSPTK